MSIPTLKVVEATFVIAKVRTSQVIVTVKFIVIGTTVE